MTARQKTGVAGNLSPLILNSLPKSGTNLLSRVFAELPGYARSGKALTYATAEGREDTSSRLQVGVSTPRGMRRGDFEQLMQALQPGQYYVGHLPYTSETRDVLDACGIRMVVILRDPRAVVCSFVHFVLSREDHVLHPTFAAASTLDARIELAIRGFEPGRGGFGLLPIAACFKSIADWADWPAATVLSFEELIGPEGGGTLADQQCALERVLQHVGYELDAPALAALGRRLFSERSITFRTGQVEAWRRDFTPYLEQCFADNAADSLRDFRRLFVRRGDSE